ncbi:MAG: DNA-formamidopyrimidine glycosylase [Candidatus Zambryskibacteria bacterium RIFOXYC1_FULL_39_10]|uniref:DNA-formamidopyrimidine glycosylase n=1 Tax=Candidatus Zambryskibacteria bacterium RIFOXYC1_FULL_39_10 TaxID=1802779 RepID=A0A1G2V042_9BACT|nr:MAG: DNA-formamidopyrimidine glycosylase [Candidatus Zambryskibacteria bacterium RIFOXYD1_FULL_39_35]OHB15005.1 MAG: DNA-formamidopyrimidine glycosylase [Candidatus Zambryskibacteria bacterium RIFOXYC1_FULL_39_10]
MPELPEVHTIVTDLKRFIPNLKIKDVWTDILAFKKIKKDVVGEKIISVERRGKNILIGITGKKIILVHQKMTGHLMYGKWDKTKDGWRSVLEGPMRDDPGNRFIHLLFFLSNGRHLGLCDMRKFASVIVLPEKTIKEKLEKLGPEPFDKNFNLKKFFESIKNKNKKIKSVLMDQSIVAGIGNIYADEVLWVAAVHPLKIASKLKKEEVKKIYEAIKPVLKRAIKARGSSYIDYRDAQGKKGKYQEMQNAYGLKGKKCKKRGCGGIIEKIVVDGRSASFCPKHQTKYD